MQKELEEAAAVEVPLDTIYELEQGPQTDNEAEHEKVGAVFFRQETTDE